MINGLLVNAVKKIVERVKRNYKLAIPQYYTDQSTNEGKIQLLLPLFLQSRNVADLALVVDKDKCHYVGKTILTLEWAYVNSRRIVKPDVDCDILFGEYMFHYLTPSFSLIAHKPFTETHPPRLPRIL